MKALMVIEYSKLEVPSFNSKNQGWTSGGQIILQIKTTENQMVK